MTKTRKVLAALALGTAALITLTIANGQDMFLLHTEIQIDAPPSDVWNALTDAERFSEWNPFLQEMRGDLEVGNKLSVTIAPPGKSSMQFTPLVLRVDENRELRWRGKLGVRGIMDGEHVFELIPTESGTRFVHYEAFSGVLVPFLRGMLERDTRPGFVAMNEALKVRAENLSSIGG